MAPYSVRLPTKDQSQGNRSSVVRCTEDWRAGCGRGQKTGRSREDRRAGRGQQQKAGSSRRDVELLRPGTSHHPNTLIPGAPRSRCSPKQNTPTPSRERIGLIRMVRMEPGDQLRVKNEPPRNPGPLLRPVTLPVNQIL